MFFVKRLNSNNHQIVDMYCLLVRSFIRSRMCACMCIISKELLKYYYQVLFVKIVFIVNVLYVIVIVVFVIII